MIGRTKLYRRLAIFGIILVMIVLAVLLVEKIQRDNCEESRDKIDGEINRARHCLAASDCVDPGFSCPFGCDVLINKKSFAQLQTLAENYQQECGECMYDCGPIRGEVACRDGQCVREDRAIYGFSEPTAPEGQLSVQKELDLKIIETPHPGDPSPSGYAGYYVVELENISDRPIEVVAFDSDIYNSLLVQYVYNPQTDSPDWNETPVPIKTLPLPNFYRLEPYPNKPESDGSGGRLRLKVPIDVNKDMALPFKFCARYSPINKIADFSKRDYKQAIPVWSGELTACTIVGAAKN